MGQLQAKETRYEVTLAVTHFTPVDAGDGKFVSSITVGYGGGTGTTDEGLGFNFSPSLIGDFDVRFKDDCMEHWQFKIMDMIEAIVAKRNEVHESNG